MGVPKSNKLCPSPNTRKILLLQGCGSEDLVTYEAPKSHLEQEGWTDHDTFDPDEFGFWEKW